MIILFVSCNVWYVISKVFVLLLKSEKCGVLSLFVSVVLSVVCFCLLFVNYVLFYMFVNCVEYLLSGGNIGLVI